MYVIAVEIIVDEKDSETFRGRARKHAANSSAEEGCLRFEIAEDEARPGRFLIWEVYRDQAAFEVHKRQPYLAAFREATAAIVKSREISMARMITD